MSRYYAQRASAGMILTEATAVSRAGIGYRHAPGIWTPAQTQAWSSIVDAVHRQGGLMALQLWHAGRASDPALLGGGWPVGPSAIAPLGHLNLLRPKRSFVIPRALSVHEITKIIEDFRLAAENAKRAGFDAVEIHAANGYLIDQFIHDRSNRRMDAYGGPIENRARLLFEIVDAIAEVWPIKQVGVHLSPRGDFLSMGDRDPERIFVYIAQRLSDRGVGFLCVREAPGSDSLGPQLRRTFKGLYIANENISGPEAKKMLANGDADAVAFGAAFISNPDLPRRLEKNLPLARPDPKTYYTLGPKGYVDYTCAAQ